MCPKQALAGATSGMGCAAALHSEAAPSSKQPRHPSINHKHTQGPRMVRPLFKGMHVHARLNTKTVSQASSAPHMLSLLHACVTTAPSKQGACWPLHRACTHARPASRLALAYYTWHRYYLAWLPTASTHPSRSTANSPAPQSTPPQPSAHRLLLLYLPKPSAAHTSRPTPAHRAP